MISLFLISAIEASVNRIPETHYLLIDGLAGSSQFNGVSRKIREGIKQPRGTQITLDKADSLLFCQEQSFRDRQQSLMADPLCRNNLHLILHVDSLDTEDLMKCLDLDASFSVIFSRFNPFDVYPKLNAIPDQIVSIDFKREDGRLLRVARLSGRLRSKSWIQMNLDLYLKYSLYQMNKLL